MDDFDNLALFRPPKFTQFTGKPEYVC